MFLGLVAEELRTLVVTDAAGWFKFELADDFRFCDVYTFCLRVLGALVVVTRVFLRTTWLGMADLVD